MMARYQDWRRMPPPDDPPAATPLAWRWAVALVLGLCAVLWAGALALLAGL